MDVAAFWKLTGPGPQNRPEMAGTGGPGAPNEQLTLIKNTKCRPKVRHENAQLGLHGLGALPDK